MKLSSLKLGKRGVFAMDSATAFILGLLSLILIAVILLVVLASVNTTAVQNATNNGSTRIIANFTQAIETFFTGMGLWFTLLGVVIMVLIVTVVIVVLKRTQGGTGGGL